MKKKINVQRDHILIEDGDHTILLSKTLNYEGCARIDFSFSVTKGLCRRLEKTGIMKIFSTAPNHLYFQRRAFYTHEKMTEILTDIIENYGTFQKQEETATAV